MTVLLVEDNPDDERLALMGLRRANVPFKVEVARDGEEAIDHIDGLQAGDIKLILLDLKLPKVSGHDVLAHVKEVFKSAAPPVIVFTSSDEPIDISRCIKLGATAFVTKPVDFEAYILTMQKIADEWLAS